MEGFGKNLKIPHLSWIDAGHVVLAKGPNIYLARTDSLRKLGYDDQIRMLDHSEFFSRAAGQLVTVGALETIVFHRHNRLDNKYQYYRQDIHEDLAYIAGKRKNNITI